MIDHPTFKLSMPADNVVFIVGHTRRDYIFANKIIDVEDGGIVIQWYLQDATLTLARRQGMYRIIEIAKAVTKDEWDKIEEANVQSYLDKHYDGMSFSEVADYGKTNGKKAG
jgi:hypothetical protein